MLHVLCVSTFRYRMEMKFDCLHDIIQYRSFEGHRSIPILPEEISVSFTPKTSEDLKSAMELGELWFNEADQPCFFVGCSFCQ